MRKMNKALICLAAALTAGYATEAEAKKICIDPGHGGSDPGAVGCGLYEEEINLSVSLKLKPLLTAAGHTVYLTRETDKDVSLGARSDYANSKGVDTFASIHTNSAGATATGIETFCYTTSTSSSPGYIQATHIQNQMLAVWSLTNRGVKKANYAVLRETNMPATLTELGFIVNCSKDATYLKSDSHRNNAAQAHCKALCAQWGGTASKCSGSTSTDPQPPATNTGYVMAGTFLNTVAQENWLGGVTYKAGSKSVVSGSTYGIMKIELPVGSYSATASKDGYNSVTRNDCAPVTAGGQSWCSIAITKKAETPAKGKATGSVKDGASGAKVAAKVTVKNGASVDYNGSTDWSFELNAGTYTITADATGYNSGSVSCTVNSGATASCPITITPKKGTIKGKVYNIETNDLIKATVSTGSQSVSYNAEGEWTFTVDAGSHTVTAEAIDYAPANVTCKVDKGATATCDIGMTPIPQESTKFGFLRGTLEDSVSGKLIAGEVRIEEDGQVYHYDAKNKWQFYLAPGTYTVAGSSAGYTENSSQCTVKSEEVTECTVKLDPQPANVAGTVYKGTDTDDYIAATITIEGTDQTIEYNGTENWTATLLPGEYTVTASAGEYNGTTTCIIEAGKDNICHIAVFNDTVKLGTLTGIVYDSRNENLTLESEVKIQGYKSIHYNGEGKWEIDQIPEGVHEVTATADGYFENTVSCTVYAGEPSYCAIPLKTNDNNGSAIQVKPMYPRVTLVAAEDACSAQSKRPASNAPYALFALAAGILAALGLRRRSNKGDAR